MSILSILIVSFLLDWILYYLYIRSYIDIDIHNYFFLVFRLRKDTTKCGYALLMPDYCLPLSIPTQILTNDMIIAIEIKPKQGFIPSFQQLSDKPCLQLKTQICRYALTQCYKVIY